MSITTISIGGEDYTSYASEAEADAYLAVDPTRAATWAGLTSDQKGGFLVAATRRLDLLMWQGSKTGGASQENQWPRTGVNYKDGTAVSTTEVPKEVENATILLAGSIALDASLSNSGTSGSNTKRLKAGSAEIEFFRPTDTAATGAKALQDVTAFDLIKCFLTGGTGASISGSLASGTDGTSSFCDKDFPGLNRGYP